MNKNIELIEKYNILIEKNNILIKLNNNLVKLNIKFILKCREIIFLEWLRIK